jgi:hypothetical protein
MGGALMKIFCISPRDKLRRRAALSSTDQTAPVSPVLWFGSSPLGVTSICSSETEKSYRRGFAPLVST